MKYRRESDIVRNNELEVTNYFFGFPDQEEELELTFNHDGRSYDLGTGYGHVAIGIDDLDATLANLKQQGIAPEREPYSVREGGSRLCFVQDPDGYRIELIEPVHRLHRHRQSDPAREAPVQALVGGGFRAHGPVVPAPEEADETQVGFVRQTDDLVDLCCCRHGAGQRTTNTSGGPPVRSAL